MSILFGHPGGNANSFQAALAHWERGRLAAFCISWLPTPREVRFLEKVPGLQGWIPRLRRRSFEPLLNAPRIEDRLGEWRRLARRMARGKQPGGEWFAYEANDWLMSTMRRHVSRPDVTAVHAYEDCSLWSFEEAKRLGKQCIYDMPIGYYPAWQEIHRMLLRQYADWLPPHGMTISAFVRPEQKVAEMQLADLVLAPSRFVEQTIHKFMDKEVRLAPYGVDLQQWHPAEEEQPRESTPLRFLFAGHISVRKGLPLLLEAWRRADLRDARLELVGSWHLSEHCRADLPASVSYLGHRSPEGLRQAYQQADVFVFPSYFEGCALVVLEALACGLPVLASDASGAADSIDESCGRIFPAGDLEMLIEQLRDFAKRRDELPAMKRAARLKAEQRTWEHYRSRVAAAVEPLVGVGV
jgi:glycosyltransferase involved in cell wall biosynthesis